MQQQDHAGKPPAVYGFEACRLAVGPRELRRNGRVQAVPSRVFDLLVYLIEHRERAIGRDELVAAVWGRIDVSDAHLGQLVVRARRAVGDDGRRQAVVRTVQKFGYRWSAPVEVLDDAPEHAAAGARPSLPMPGAVVGARARPAPRRPLLALLASVLLVATAFAMTRSGVDTPRSMASGADLTAIVLPVDVAALPGLEWIRLGGMDVLAAELRAGGLRVPASDPLLGLLEGDDADARLRRTHAPALVVRAGMVAGRAGWRAVVSADDADGTRVQADGAAAEPLAALRQAADALLLRLGAATGPRSGDAAYAERAAPAPPAAGRRRSRDKSRRRRERAATGRPAAGGAPVESLRVRASAAVAPQILAAGSRDWPRQAFAIHDGLIRRPCARPWNGFHTPPS